MQQWTDFCSHHVPKFHSIKPRVTKYDKTINLGCIGGGGRAKTILQGCIKKNQTNDLC